MPDDEYEARTSASYDRIADEVEPLWRDDLAGRPEDRAFLAAFAERVRGTGDTTVLDAGCGTGRLTALLRSLGLTPSGIDLSPGMVAVARERHPATDFRVGTMTDLPAATASYAGVLAFYSIIHLPDDVLPAAFDEFARVLVPGGYLALAFQTGAGDRHLTEAFGQSVDLVFRRVRITRATDLASGSGFDVVASMRREPAPGDRTPHGFVLAQRRLPRN